MVARSGAMHVARNKRTYVAKSGERRVYESVLLRRTYRDGGKVRHETLANLSALPEQAVDGDRGHAEGRAAGAGRAGGDHHRGRCRTGTSPPCTRWPASWACPRCSARPAGSGTWPWR